MDQNENNIQDFKKENQENTTFWIFFFLPVQLINIWFRFLIVLKIKV